MPDPMYAATDWMAAYDRLRQQGMAQPEGTQLRAGGMPDWWWQEQQYRERRTPGFIQRPEDAQAIPFGDIADPVSQLAFLLSPHLLAGMKAVGTQAAQPGYSRSIGGFRLGERGNLGPPPVGPRGELLPESVVRGEQGELQRLYHGTSRTYPDFEANKFGSGAGGDLYGPGIYMTEHPGVAEGYAKQNLGYTSDALLHGLERDRATIIDKIERLRQKGSTRPADLKEMQWQEVYRDRLDRSIAEARGHVPNVRPVYADLKKPFDIEAPVSPAMVRKLDEIGVDYYLKPNGSPAIAGNKDVYALLERHFGGKNEVNDWLQANGYDGITHIGGSGDAAHRVYIAFTPDTVYPSFNVDALRPAGGAR